MTSWSARRWMFRMGALLLAFGLVAAACGGSDDSSGGERRTRTRAARSPPIPTTGPTPTRGGSITFAREAETSSPWTPSAMICDVACHQAIKGIYDTLIWPDAEGEVHGMLLESFEPNADFTEWTLTPREGITFHDGTPWDVAGPGHPLHDDAGRPSWSATSSTTSPDQADRGRLPRADHG